MMRTARWAAMTAFMPFLGGCVVVRSQVPLYQSEQRIVDASLHGTWIGQVAHEEEDEIGPLLIFVLEPGPDRSYQLALEMIPFPQDDAGGRCPDDEETPQGDQPRDIACGWSDTACIDLVPIGSRLFAFVRESDGDAQEPRTYALPLYRLTRHHEPGGFGRPPADCIDLDFILPWGFAEALQKSSDELPYEFVDDCGGMTSTQPDGKIIRLSGEMLLCASAADVQDFLRRHEDDGDVFTRIASLRKATPRR